MLIDFNIAALKNGDYPEFERVFRLTHKKVYSYFLSKTRSTALSDDLTQNVFLKLWQFRHALSATLSLDAQLFRISRTILVDHFRQLVSERRKIDGLTVEGDNASTNQFEARQYLETTLDILPPVRRRVFVLKKLYGFSYKEIANELQISPRTVEKHVSLAIKQLTDYMGSLNTWLFILIFTKWK